MRLSIIELINSMFSIRLFSPAKINLFLKVIGKRADGYHELSSLFQTISAGDILTFQRQTVDTLTCSDPYLPTDDSNLVLKAMRLFRSKTGLDLHLRIHLDKRLPSQAGLGGGSSNAATTLWACNQLAGEIVTTEELMQWGSEIGADVPFFFSKGTAHCTGRGECVNSLEPLAHCKIWIVKPPFGLSTPEVYKQLNFSQPNENNNDYASFKEKPYFNDLEASAFEIKPELKILKNTLLSSGFDTVLMSGSGSSFFCIGQGQIPASFKAFSAYFINRSSNRWYSTLPKLT
ncbi:4-diphosphocytidyl-2-C-methyl-D-erythritol kinase [Candidatus Protochlamydia amoebophila]|uniref:4-diphosphocytidyl-2-C-methyl-D-erythritol kinase n=2 Tax=Candidatus Protochlamydia amoebophila TaxID=362787 RepID=A0A0C1JKN5_9BACT|nr:4-diphosphocytidyl-2-C-methyl-D-erythritol kinase [Candidatus Protochlamydia amoebophila]